MTTNQELAFLAPVGGLLSAVIVEMIRQSFEARKKRKEANLEQEKLSSTLSLEDKKLEQVDNQFLVTELHKMYEVKKEEVEKLNDTCKELDKINDMKDRVIDELENDRDMWKFKYIKLKETLGQKN